MDGGNYGKIRINSTLKKYKRCTEFLLCYISLCFYVSRHSAQVLCFNYCNPYNGLLSCAPEDEDKTKEQSFLKLAQVT